MSGGRWNYAENQITEDAELTLPRLALLLKAVAQTEHLIDWAESADTSRADAESKVYDLWVATFDEVYGP